jgi:GT2 family glycosyltransferase
MLQASVIICTHNPRPHYLRRVLEALRVQTLSLKQWELLLIDNASQEPLTACNWNLSWHPQARRIREDELGLAPARHRGMREARAGILIFVDDDNILASDYLDQAVRIGREWPILGVWGSGATIPEFEVRPPDALLPYLDKLAIRDSKTIKFGNIIGYYGVMPWGAGQCVRAEVATFYRRYFESSSIKITGRTGTSFDSAEDLETCYAACASGRGVGIFPELKLIHLIPKERLEEDYLVKLSEGISTSNLLVEYKWQKSIPVSPFASFGGILRMMRNVLARRRVQRRMYLAELRSVRRVRKIILEYQDAVKTH